MRFIIHELPYEQPLAKGLWRYEQDGRATGAVEHWRLSTAHDGFYFMRIDLDARQAPSGRSYLYHLILDGDGRPVRLQYRLWYAQSETVGNVLLEANHVLITSGTGDGRFEELTRLPQGYQFWFPSSTVLGLVARNSFTEAPALTLIPSAPDQEELALLPLVTTLRKTESSPSNDTQKMRLSWEDQWRKVWLNELGWPVRMERQDRLTAVEAQLVRYQRINTPGAQIAPFWDAM